MDQSNEYLKRVIETLLFISEKPVTLEQLKEAIETTELPYIKSLIAQLKEEYETQGRGMVIMEIAGGYQMLSNPSYVSYVKNFFKTRVKEKLSRPALETLAIIAYKQPVSRMDIELIRGVNSDGVVIHLLNKGLIKIVGRKDIPGRPYLYGTTRQFMEYFGLRSLQDLPKLEEFSALVQSAQRLQEEDVKKPEPLINKESQNLIKESELAQLDEAQNLLVQNENPMNEVKEQDNSSLKEDVVNLKKVMEEIQEDAQALLRSPENDSAIEGVSKDLPIANEADNGVDYKKDKISPEEVSS